MSKIDIDASIGNPLGTNSLRLGRACDDSFGRWRRLQLAGFYLFLRESLEPEDLDSIRMTAGTALIVRRLTIGGLPSVNPVPENAQNAMYDCENPKSKRPEEIVSMLSPQPFELCATAINPSTPQLPPSSYGREPGGVEIAFAIVPPSG